SRRSQARIVSAGMGTATKSRRSPSGTVLGGEAIAILQEDLARAIPLPPADDVDLLALEELVGLEEVLDLDQPVRPDLVEALDVLLVRVADGHAQHLEVETLLVAHLEAADRARPDVAAGERGLVDHEQGVGVVSVAGPRALDEAVVEVVEHRRGQHAVQA